MIKFIVLRVKTMNLTEHSKKVVNNDFESLSGVDRRGFVYLITKNS